MKEKPRKDGEEMQPKEDPQKTIELMKAELTRNRVQIYDLTRVLISYKLRLGEKLSDMEKKLIVTTM